jgi:hypothetical protein
MAGMLETTNWPRLYAVAALIGAGAGLLLSLGALPSAPEWPAQWGVPATSRILIIVTPIAGGALVGVILAAVAHLGVRYQLRRRSSREGEG